jgi:hypothetical protein
MGWVGKGSRHERGYGRVWDKTRLVILLRDKYLCQPCAAKGRTTPASQVDHIKPKALGGDDDHSNLQSICDACHKVKTNIEDRLASLDERRGFSTQVSPTGWPVDDGHPANTGQLPRRWGFSIPHNVRTSGIPVELVCGPPASGKTTYVRAHAGRGDTVIDLDSIKVRVGGRAWDSSPVVTSKAMAYRDRMIRGLADKRAGKAFLIVGAPTIAERKAWAAALGRVSVTLLGTDEAACIARIEASAERSHAAENLKRAVREWFAASRR